MRIRVYSLRTKKSVMNINKNTEFVDGEGGLRLVGESLLVIERLSRELEFYVSGAFCY
jgi:hypothetical protein